jgi:hypothetical protein
VDVAEKDVNFPWAICLAQEDAMALAALRLVAGLEVAEQGGLVWVRGPQVEERLEVKVAGLPARARYEWLPPNGLRPVDCKIPLARLPEVQWRPLAAWLRVETPLAAMAGTPPPGLSLRLVRSTREQEPELLLTGLEEFRDFAMTAAQVRLERLHFAANVEGQVLVRGRPLPPLPGRRFVLNGGVAVPAGFSWEPAISAEVLARRFAASEETVVLWNEDGTFTRLHREQFFPASRSAVRATAEGVVERR